MRDDYLDKVCTFYGILFMLEILEDVQSYNHLQKKHWKNCASSEKAVTTSKTLTEYTMRSCTTIASNNCQL